MSNINLQGFLDLEEQLSDILVQVEDIDEVLEIGASEFVKDLLKLPKPKSSINKAGYTHMIDSFAYSKSKFNKNEIEVGWGKYYGRMVEEGTRKSKRQEHLKPTFERNKSRYYEKMISKLKLN